MPDVFGMVISGESREFCRALQNRVRAFVRDEGGQVLESGPVTREGGVWFSGLSWVGVPSELVEDFAVRQIDQFCYHCGRARHESEA